MIIRSRLPQSSVLYRLTRLSDPSSIPLNQILQDLLIQWGINSTSYSSSNSSSNFAFLVKLNETEDRLVIDKQNEWKLFLEQNNSKQEDHIVEVEIVDRSYVLDKSIGKDPSAIVSSLQNQINTLQEQVRNLSSRSTGLAKESTSASVPKYAFHSVEPQAIKAPKKEHEQPPPSIPPQPSQQTQTQAAMSLDEIMERSRRQGETLNHLFGAMQARSAGRTHSVEQEEEEPSTSTMTQEVNMQEPIQNQEEAGPSSSSPRRTTEDVGKVNDYLQDAWQERLAQMGHGPNSGSPYAKLRTGKIKEIPSDAADSSSSEATRSGAYQVLPINAENEPSSSAMVVTTSTSGPRELHEITEEMITSSNRGSEELVAFPTSASVQPSPQPDNVGVERFINREDSISAGNTLSSNRSARTSLFKNKLFKHRRGNSDLQQSSGRETPEGARTPQSFNSSIFKRRPLSVRSLSDALIGSARERANTGESSSSLRRAIATTNGNVTPVQSNTRHRHRGVRSLTDFQFLSLPQRRKRNDSTHSVPISDLSNPSAMMASQGEGLAARSEMQTDSLGITIGQTEEGSTITQSHSNTKTKNTVLEISRPSLLRASHSTPLSSTAVNLAGGITLHASSVGDPSFTWTERVDDTHEELSKVHKPARNLFDIMLPREIQLDCLRALIELHQDEMVPMRNLTGNQTNALRKRGKANGMRELIRLSRVSRNWQSLMLDGQLWSDLDVSVANNISDECLKRIVRTAGPFIKTINLRNMQNLSSKLLTEITSPNSTYLENQQNGGAIPGLRQRSKSAIRLPSSALMMCNISLPSLTRLNLQGCRSIDKEALHHALVRLPQLEHLNVSNLTAVNNETLLILGASLPRLKSLNVSRCVCVTGDGLINFIDAAQGSLYDQSLFKKGEKMVVNGISEIALDLQELRASGLREIDVPLMNSMGMAMRNLRVLDLSYSTDLSDEAIAAFTRHPGPPIWSNMKDLGIKYSSMTNDEKLEKLYGPFISLSARQAGGNILSDDQHYRRLHLHLNHLILSSCRSLTDRSCIYLAHSSPQLRFLELANIGNGLHDAGLVKLLETTPKIERVDVEGAIELGDKFIQALTPSESYLESTGFNLSIITDSVGTTTTTRLINPSNRVNTLGRIGRRTLRRSRQATGEGNTTSTENEEAPEQIVEDQQIQIATPTVLSSPSKVELSSGAKLTHLIISHLSKVDPNVLLTLIRRCPKLIHLEVDDTRANDALLNEFVALSKQRKSFGAYISLVDCRALSKSANAEVFASGSARPREGQIGDEFDQFHYEGGNTKLSDNNTIQSMSKTRDAKISESNNTNESSTSHNKVSGSSLDECDESLIVVKTFWAWQAVDVRNRIRKKAEAKRLSMLAKLQNKNGLNSSSKFEGSLRSASGRVRDPLAAALNFISSGGLTEDDDLEDGQGRWSRITTGLLGPNDEGEDARGCVVM